MHGSFLFSALLATVILNLFQDLMALGVAHLTSAKKVESRKRRVESLDGVKKWLEGSG